MKITNKTGLPDTFYQAVKNDKYDKGDADYSVSELISPPQITILKQRHDKELEEDVCNMIWALLGKAVHHILEIADNKDAITEERIFLEIAGRKVSGQTDLYSEDK